MNRTVTANAAARPAGALNIALWLVQLLLAAAFIISGYMKLMTPIEELVAANMAWTGDVPSMLVRFIGMAELAGAVGVMLPALLRIAPGLTPMAAVGLLTIMVLATLFHLTRGEYQGMVITLVLGLLAAFVAWGRLVRAPIPRRA
jgi:uncharacterized membrane protein YphA (DoxX/SURF4 family)